MYFITIPPQTTSVTKENVACSLPGQGTFSESEAKTYQFTVFLTPEWSLLILQD